MLLEVGPQTFVDERLDQPAHIAVSELGLGLALELGFRNFDGNHGDQSLAHVIAVERLVVLLEQVVRNRVGVHRARERRTKSAQVGAAFDRIDIVREREDVFRVGIVPLHGDLDRHAAALALQIDHVVVDLVLAAIEMFDERDDAALVVELLALAALALVLERDAHAAVQERELTQAASEDVEAIIDRVEDFVIGAKAYRGAALVRHTGLLERFVRNAAHVTLAIDLPVAPDFDLQPFRKRVHDRHADPVQTAGDLVRAFLELAAGVQLRQDDFGGGNAFARV